VLVILAEIMNEKKRYLTVINATPPSRGLCENYFRTIKYYPNNKI
jgi:hypothetical protein